MNLTFFSFQEDEEPEPLPGNRINLIPALRRLGSLHPELLTPTRNRSRTKPKRPKTSRDNLEKVPETKLFRVKYPDSRDPIPVRTMTLSESCREHPTVSHSWLCNGKLLVLEDPKNQDNIGLFQVRDNSVASSSRLSWSEWSNVDPEVLGSTLLLTSFFP